MINLGLIGAGTWGSRYLDTIGSMDGVRISAICCRSAQPPVNIPYDCSYFTDWSSMLKIIARTNMCDGIIVATPPESHVAIASESLKLGLATMIEKPVALRATGVQQLMKIRTQAPVLVNHIHLFSSAYETLKRVVQSPVTAIQSCGWNRGPVRNYSSLHDYGPHDLSMCIDLLRSLPTTVKASRAQTEAGEIYNIILRWGNIPAVVRVGNGGMSKRRLFQVFCGHDTYEYDDTQESKLTLNGEPLPVRDTGSPLKNAVAAFCKSIQGDTDHRCGLDLALQVSQVLDMCIQSLNAAV